MEEDFGGFTEKAQQKERAASAAPPPPSSTPALLTKQATGSERSPGSQRFCYVLLICTARLSRGHKRRNSPVSKLA